MVLSHIMVKSQVVICASRVMATWIDVQILVLNLLLTLCKIQSHKASLKHMIIKSMGSNLLFLPLVVAQADILAQLVI